MHAGTLGVFYKSICEKLGNEKAAREDLIVKRNLGAKEVPKSNSFKCLIFCNQKEKKTLKLLNTMCTGLIPRLRRTQTQGCKFSDFSQISHLFLLTPLKSLFERLSVEQISPDFTTDSEHIQFQTFSLNLTYIPISCIGKGPKRTSSYMYLGYKRHKRPHLSILHVS